MLELVEPWPKAMALPQGKYVNFNGQIAIIPYKVAPNVGADGNLPAFY